MLAERQHGHVTRKQLVELGFADGTITYRLRTGRLHRVYPGIYAVGHRRNAPIDRAAAAVLASGPGAVLSHASAAALWGFTYRWQEPFEVTVSGDRRPKRIRSHRSRLLLPRDRTRHLGIPVTSPARTVLDYAPRPERRFRLPPYEINAFVGDREVDVLFRAERVIVELDGYDFHKGRGAFERDRNQDVDALLRGFVTVRITWPRMNLTPAQEAERLQTILRRRRQELGP